jgi:hypothetical protein
MRKMFTPHVRAMGQCTFPPASTVSSDATWAGPGTRRLPQVLVEVSARAGQPLWIPGDVAGKCCSTPRSSKGHIRGHEWMAVASCGALWEWSEHDTLPVIIDAASCTYELMDEVRNYLDEEHRARSSRSRCWAPSRGAAV